MASSLIAKLSAPFGVLASPGVGRAGRAAPNEAAAKAADLWSSRYTRAGVEPPLEEVLGDPIVQMVMRSDRVERNKLPRLAARWEP